MEYELFDTRSAIIDYVRRYGKISMKHVEGLMNAAHWRWTTQQRVIKSLRKYGFLSTT